MATTEAGWMRMMGASLREMFRHRYGDENERFHREAQQRQQGLGMQQLRETQQAMAEMRANPTLRDLASEARVTREYAAAQTFGQGMAVTAGHVADAMRYTTTADHLADENTWFLVNDRLRGIGAMPDGDSLAGREDRIEKEKMLNETFGEFLERKHGAKTL